MIRNQLIKNRFYSTFNSFDRYAKRWWDVDGDMFILHDYNHVRVPFIAKSYELCKSGQTNIKDVKGSIFEFDPLRESEERDKVDKQLILNGLSILDVGCGGGILSECLAKYGCKVLGIDVSKELIDVANAHKDSHFVGLNDKFGLRDDYSNNLQYKVMPVEDCNNLETYDIVVASEVIEHIENNKKAEFISNLCKLVKSDGILVITTPGRSFKSCLFNIYFAEYILCLLPKNTHKYNLFISETECSDLLLKHNFKLINRQGLIYIPFLRRFIHTNTTDILYMAAYKNCQE